MEKNNDIVKELINIAAERKNLQKLIDENKKRQIEFCDIINKSAIFDESIIFYIAQLLSYKEKNAPFLPFSYNKYKLFQGEFIEETYIGISPEENIVDFINDKNENLNDFFKNKLGYEIFHRETKVIENNAEDKIINYRNYYNDGKKIMFEFLLDNYRVKNSYPISASLYNFENFDYVQNFINYLFEIQVKNNGNQLTPSEIHEGLREFLEFDKKYTKVLKIKDK